MKQESSNRIGDTVRIQRPPPRVFTDQIGRNIWMSGVEHCELELEAETESASNPYDSFGSKVM